MTNDKSQKDWLAEAQQSLVASKEHKLQATLCDIQIKHEKDMQLIAEQIANLNDEYQKDIKQVHIELNILLPEKHKPPDILDDCCRPGNILML